MSNAAWNNNSVQFPRLLAEIRSVVALGPEQYRAMCESMDLSRDEIEELFDRADVQWEKAKGNLPEDVPFQASAASTRVRMTLDVAYDLNGENIEDMTYHLRRVAEGAIGGGLLTGDSGATVDFWNLDVAVIPESPAEDESHLDEFSVPLWAERLEATETRTVTLTHPEEAYANARLMRAAPNLLAAAQKALDECCDLVATDAGNALSAAIANAIGYNARVEGEALYRDKSSYYGQLAKTLAANADNENLSDAEFRQVVRNSIPEFRNIDTGDAPLGSKGLMIEIDRRRALIEGQLRDIAALERQHADAESREFIAEHGITADMVQSSGEGGFHGTVQEFGQWMRQTGCEKPWAEWNGRLYISCVTPPGYSANSSG